LSALNVFIDPRSLRLPLLTCGQASAFQATLLPPGLALFNVPRASVQAFIPPSTVRFAPVMYEDSGPATNATIAAISSTRP